MTSPHKKDPTEITVDDRIPGMTEKFQPKIYTKALVEYANQSLREDELNLYNSLFEEMKVANKLEKAEDLILLDMIVYDWLRIKRIQSILMKEGDTIVIKLRNGQNITKVHEASYLINAIETQLRNNMREMMLTRKEVVKKQIGLGQQDFASFLNAKTINAEFEVETDGKK